MEKSMQKMCIKAKTIPKLPLFNFNKQPKIANACKKPFEETF